MNQTTPTSSVDGNSARPPASKPKANQAEFAEAQRACRTAAEREQLALVRRARWTSAELAEYARLFYFKNGKDYPTAQSYRRAIADLGRHYHLLTSARAKPSDFPHDWLQRFRRGGSRPMPPRRQGLLIRARDMSHRVTSEEYSWPDHTEEYRSMIEQRCRDYFGNIPIDQAPHVNAWAASQRAYQREIAAQAKAQEVFTLVLSPKVLKKSKTKAPRRKIVSSVDVDDWYFSSKLKPHFSFEFPHHTPSFLEEVTALARNDRRLPPSAPISPNQWKRTCNKYYCLIESNEA